MKKSSILLKVFLCICGLGSLSGCNGFDGPDLVARNEELSISEDGLTTVLSFQIRNIGTEASTACEVLIIGVNPDLGTENQIVYKNRIEIGPLEPARETETLTYIIQQNSPNELGIQYYQIIADEKNVVIEASEENNLTQINLD